MLDQLVPKVINESLDWFFKKFLVNHYEEHRELLYNEAKKATMAIDYIVKTHIDKDASYPPHSSAEWIEFYVKSNSIISKQILLIYLKLDINSYLSTKESSVIKRTKDKTELVTIEAVLSKLLSFPNAFDFPHSIIDLSTGLWAIDNKEPVLAVTLLNNPSICLQNIFDNPRELVDIIVDIMIVNHQPRLALVFRKTHRHDNWDDDYDAIYAFLLVSSGHLVEALKYERMFSDRENYHDILVRFFELCSEWNVTKSLNCLNLSIEEEDVLNQFLISESRPVTPSNTQARPRTPTASKRKPRNRSLQVIQRVPSFNDSPARNTRSANKKKAVK